METFTFLFTDIEGSTVLLRRLREGLYAQVLDDYRSLIRSGLAAHGGREVDTQGDGLFAVFSSPSACLAAVIEMQEALETHAWPGGEHVRVRMASTRAKRRRRSPVWSAWMSTAPPGWPRSGTAARSCCPRRRPP